MKQSIKTILIMLFVATATTGFANSHPKNQHSLKTNRPPLPEENIGDKEGKDCKVPGLLTIYPNNVYHCHLISTKACVFVDCSALDQQGGGNNPGIQKGVKLPGNVEIPAGQNFIGYYDESNVFNIIYVNSLSITRDASTNSIEFKVNP